MHNRHTLSVLKESACKLLKKFPARENVLYMSVYALHLVELQNIDLDSDLPCLNTVIKRPKFNAVKFLPFNYGIIWQDEFRP